MLYQIDGTSTRLLGTMHLVPQGQHGWIPYVRRSFDWSEKRVLEMHLRRIPELLGLRSPHPRDLPADIQQRVEDRWNAESLGPLESVNLPMMLLVIGGMNIEAMKGVEAQLIDWASGEGDFGELESPAEMLEAFANVPAQTFVDALRWRLPRDAEAAQRLAQIYRAWRGNSADKMMKITRIGLPEPIREAMFDQRNRLWAPRVCELAKRSERTLVCVGAGHLHGKNNLRDLLAGQGLTCSRIQP